MESIRRSAQLLISDLAATIVFLIALVVTRNVMLAVALGVAFGVAQVGWLLARRQRIDAMQWLSIGLVIVAGAASLLTEDPRFVMLKPTVVYCVVGAYMLRPGWLNRYLPPMAIQAVPDLAYAFGFAWAGLMFVSAALNVVLVLRLDPVAWSLAMSIWGLASKTALFIVQVAVMRFVGRRRVRGGLVLPT